jgi:hypothetical protein
MRFVQFLPRHGGEYDGRNLLGACDPFRVMHLVCGDGRCPGALPPATLSAPLQGEPFTLMDIVTIKTKFQIVIPAAHPRADGRRYGRPSRGIRSNGKRQNFKWSG